jgi:hypothetical protein
MIACAISEFRSFEIAPEPRLAGFHFSLNLTAIKFLRLLVIRDLDPSYGMRCFKGILVLYKAAFYCVLHDLHFFEIFRRIFETVR